MAVRQPIAQKFAIFSTAITELLDWDKVYELANNEEEDIGKSLRLLLATMAKFLDWDQFEYNHLGDYKDHMHWDRVKQFLFPNFKEKINSALTNLNGFPRYENLKL